MSRASAGERPAEQRSWLGIDFSGDHTRWRAGCRRSNVWLARVRGGQGALELVQLCRVQALAGSAHPFERLAAYLAVGDFEAVGMDAPLSLPHEFIPRGGHPKLLEEIAKLPCDRRPFPESAALVRAVTGRSPPLHPPKPLRRTERRWRAEGINVRSTLWAGARPGAAMTAACLKLLAMAGVPVWPWSHRRGCAAEAFPAAQLSRWGLPHERYDGASGAGVRKEIVDELGRRVRLGGFRRELEASADATDAVLCCFAAIAVTEARLADPPEPIAATEGWIAVHR